MPTPAIFKNGKIELLEPMELQEGTQLSVTKEDTYSPKIKDRSLTTKKQVIEFALEIFRNNKTVVRSWLSSPNGALNNAMPIDLLDTPGGIEEVKEIGDRWVKSQTSAVLSVSSAVIPEEKNYLLNPNHPDFQKIIFNQPQEFKLDFRLVKQKSAWITQLIGKLEARLSV